MLIFIDESGHPKPTDASTRPVILAVCLKEGAAGQLMKTMFSLRKSLLSGLPLTKDEREGKATALLNRYSLTKVAAKREYAESLFEFLRDFELTVFAVVMERPPRELYQGPEFLQRQFRWLLQRIDRFMEREDPNGFAIPIFDGQDPSSNRNFSESFTGFLVRTDVGRAMKHVVPSPLFVDSSLTFGIQVADLFAYVIRLNHEHSLYQTPSVKDPYLSAIKRYAIIIRQKTLNFELDDGMTWYGITTMDANKFFYSKPESNQEIGASEAEAAESQPAKDPTPSN